MLLVLGIAGAALGLIVVGAIIFRDELRRVRIAKNEDTFWKIVHFNDLDKTDEHEG